MPATDFFGVNDAVKRLDAPAGYEAVHQDGYSWARAGTTYEDSTRLGPEAWNQLVANFRALLTIPGVVFDDEDPRSAYLLRDVITAYIGIKGAALLPGVLINNIPALAADDDFMAAFATAAAVIVPPPPVVPNVVLRNYVTGAAWLSSTSAADNNWLAVCWASELGLFCAVGITGTGNRVMTSPDGITWTVRTSAADND